VTARSRATQRTPPPSRTSVSLARAVSQKRNVVAGNNGSSSSSRSPGSVATHAKRQPRSVSLARGNRKEEPVPDSGPRTKNIEEDATVQPSPSAQKSASSSAKAQLDDDIQNLQSRLDALRQEKQMLAVDTDSKDGSGNARSFHPRPIEREPLPVGWDTTASDFEDDEGAGDCIDHDFEPEPNPRQIFPCPAKMEEHKVIYGLGKGGFSSVMLVMRQSDDKLFALKVINKKMIRESKHRKRLQVERLILQRLPANPFIAQLSHAFQTENELFMLMDYCAGGDLCYQCFRIFTKIERFNDNQARFYISEITMAIEHLHAYGFVHRDIKPENIMLDDKGHLKLIDFGLCKKIRSASEVKAMLVDPTRATFDLEPMSPCGSLAFVPPETLEQLGSFAGDWWGMGVIAFELLTGHFPWRNVGTGDDDALRAEIREGLTDMPEGLLSRSATSLLRGLLEMQVPLRLGFFSAQQVKSHSFFRGLEWDKVLHREYEPPFHPCRPKKSTDKHGNVRYRQEPVLGINNFGKDQRDLAFNHYMRERGDGCKYPVYRGFELAKKRPGIALPPTQFKEIRVVPTGVASPSREATTANGRGGATGHATDPASIPGSGEASTGGHAV